MSSHWSSSIGLHIVSTNLKQEVEILTEQDIYKRFLSTWEAHKPQIRQLLLSTIKADIKARITANTTKLDDECEKRLHIHDTREEEEELRRELEQVVNVATLKHWDGRGQYDDVEEEEEEEDREEGGREVNDDNARESGGTKQDWGDDPDM